VTTDPERPALYHELAGWFHLLTAPADYVEEAELAVRLLRDAVDGPLASLLELGAGGGNLASCLPPGLRLTLTDVSDAMLAQSRAINPGAEHLVGDMRTLRLGREFDAVMVHDAVMYMTTADDLRAAIETAHVHTRPGGAALFVPDAVRETWQPETRHGGHDGPDGRALRYLEWTHDPDPDDTTYTTDFAIVLREADGRVRVVPDRHVEGVFARDDWLGLLRDAGFAPEAVTDAWGRELFVARRAGGASASGGENRG
jgi:hypothetical protein